MNVAALACLDLERIGRIWRLATGGHRPLALVGDGGQTLWSTDPGWPDPRTGPLALPEPGAGGPVELAPGTALGCPLRSADPHALAWLVTAAAAGPGEALLEELAAELGEVHALHAELEDMATELGERYEELNLVYTTEDQVEGEHWGSDVLDRLVASCVSYLSVEQACLVLPEKGLAFRHPELPDDRHLPEAVMGTLLRRLQAGAGSLVLNTATDQHEAGIVRPHPARLLACPVLDGMGGTCGMLVVSRPTAGADFSNGDRKLVDVMARKAAKVLQGIYDSLTGLLNRRGFEACVAEALKRARRHGGQSILMVLDIDRFRIINDLHGTGAGDALLVQVARRLGELVGVRGHLARFGGDEFAVLLEGWPPDRAMAVARKLGGEITLEWKAARLHTTLSVGIVPIPADVGRVPELLSAADLACNTAKEQVSTRIYVYRDGDARLMQRRSEMLWVSRVKSALAEDRLALYAQAIAPLQPGHERHFEVLLRLLDEDGTVVPPGAFMPAVERYRLMPEIDAWVVRHTLETLEARPQAVRLATFGINLSGQSLADEAFLEGLLRQLRRTSVPNRSLYFEITETTAIANLEQLQEFITLVKAMGCRFALDDFGTGMSSFAYLKSLPVDFLKIDGSFVRRVLADPVDAAVVEMANQVAHLMGLQTIAEFVEDEDIVAFLTRLGVDYGQGYAIHRPAPLEGVLDALLPEAQAAIPAGNAP